MGRTWLVLQATNQWTKNQWKGQIQGIKELWIIFHLKTDR